MRRRYSVSCACILVASVAASGAASAGPETAIAWSTSAVNVDGGQSNYTSQNVNVTNGLAVAVAPVNANGTASAAGSASAQLQNNGFALTVDSMASAALGSPAAAGNTSTASIEIDRTVSSSANNLVNINLALNLHANDQPAETGGPFFFAGNYYTQAFGFQAYVIVNNVEVFSAHYDSSVARPPDPNVLLQYNFLDVLNPGDHLYAYAELQAVTGANAYQISDLFPASYANAHIDPPTLTFGLSALDPGLQLLSDSGNAAITADQLMVAEPATVSLFGVSAAFLAARRRVRRGQSAAAQIVRGRGNVL